ncbi:ABC transporter substrate-binding protein [Bacillus sp. J14TS2]|uniref:extracellular solute-binding protein n=1 Tax=Bacillus sp. J14TS2 TaxID=2807188 RepID=UPI001B0BF989|nr:extracellular solute-binding protein [Bacillus sp. J14TS2]GIN70861.1 ABC transporter substrate-binding protein [Bacillus sp. J14TS2]
MKGKKVFIAVIALTLLLLSACSKQQGVDKEEQRKGEEIKASGMPIVEEPINLKFFAERADTTAEDWNDVLLYNEYEKITNINIDWEMVPSAGLTEKRNLVLASGNLPDAFHTTSMPVTDLQKYGAQGTFIQLNDLIDEYAPNFKKILEEYPEIKDGITMPDGNIYSFPYAFSPDFVSMLLSSRPWIREDWLEALDMEMPTTTDELYQFLKAVKEQDPNGNGQADEIPFGANSIDTLVEWVQGSYGLGNRGLKHKFVDMDSEQEELRFFPTTNEYKEMLQYIHKLFDEGLIDQNIFSASTDQYLAKGSEGVYGVTHYFSPDVLFGKEGENYIGAEALASPNHDRLYTSILPPVPTPGAFVITSANEHPAATVRWIDHFYGEEGAKLFFMGVEGVTYEETEDGEYEYVDEIKNDPDGLTVEQAVSKYLTYPGGTYPALVTEEYFQGSQGTDMSLDAADRLEPHLIEEVWPAFIFTDEEQKVMDTSGADIEKYVNEMRDRFIVGESSFSEWDKYIETIEKMGLEKYMETQQKAYERYKSSKGKE